MATLEALTYIDTTTADEYFETRFNNSAWEDASLNDKEKALVTATRLIDNLNFIGNKFDPLQDLEFPRDYQLAIPDDIKIATCEIAFALLDGVDPDMEIANIAKDIQRISTVQTRNTRNFVLDYIRAGIPSAKAWEYLLPYLVAPGNIKLTRI